MKEIFPGVFKRGERLFTRNLTPGKSVYGEELVRVGGKEFRSWIPTRSKAAAAILNGLKEFPVRRGSKILYLGAATGTTTSHFSDIVEAAGIIYGVEFSPRCMRELVKVAEARKNVVPILADARRPQDYDWVEEVEVVYCDIAQPDEVEIAMRNARRFLGIGGWLMIAIKSRSIDVTKEPKEIYELEVKKLEGAGFRVMELVDLEPYEKDHAMVVAKLE